MSSPRTSLESKLAQLSQEPYFLGINASVFYKTGNAHLCFANRATADFALNSIKLFLALYWTYALPGTNALKESGLIDSTVKTFTSGDLKGAHYFYLTRQQHELLVNLVNNLPPEVRLASVAHESDEKPDKKIGRTRFYVGGSNTLADHHDKEPAEKKYKR